MGSDNRGLFLPVKLNSISLNQWLAVSSPALNLQHQRLDIKDFSLRRVPFWKLLLVSCNFRLFFHSLPKVYLLPPEVKLKTRRSDNLT